MTHRHGLLAAAALALTALTALGGCPDPCDGTGDPSLVLGKGTGSTFFPFDDGEDVGLDVAPQGGFGVTVRASTTGLQTGAIELTVDSLIDDALTGSFTIEAIQLYCQDDGTGLVWGAVVGFDPAVYKTNDDLLALDDTEVTLRVTAIDERGVEAVGESRVTVQVGE